MLIPTLATLVTMVYDLLLDKGNIENNKPPVDTVLKVDLELDRATQEDGATDGMKIERATQWRCFCLEEYCKDTQCAASTFNSLYN